MESGQVAQTRSARSQGRGRSAGAADGRSGARDVASAAEYGAMPDGGSGAARERHASG